MSDSNNDLQFTTQDLNELAYSIGQDFSLSDISDIHVVEEPVTNEKGSLLTNDDETGQTIMQQDEPQISGHNAIDLDMDTIVIETINNEMDMNDPNVFENVGNEVSISSTGSLEKQNNSIHTGSNQTNLNTQSYSKLGTTKGLKPAKIRAPQTWARQPVKQITGTSQPQIISSFNINQIGNQLFSNVQKQQQQQQEQSQTQQQTQSQQQQQQQQQKGKIIKKVPITTSQVEAGSTLKVIYTSQGQQIVFSPAKTNQTSSGATIVNFTNNNVSSISKVVNLANGTPTGKVISIPSPSTSSSSNNNNSGGGGGKVMIKPVEKTLTVSSSLPVSLSLSSSSKTTTSTLCSTSPGQTQHPQQVIILSSPVKTPGSCSSPLVQTGKVISTNIKSPQRPLAPAPPIPKIAISKSGSLSTGEVKPVQLIRVVPVSTSQTIQQSSASGTISGTTTTTTTTTTKFIPLRPIAPNTKSGTAVTGLSASSMQKVLVPASALKAIGGTPVSPGNLSQGTILAATGPGGTGQVFMLPTNAPLLKIASPSGTVQAVSANKSVTFATTPTLTSQRTNYVPIAPSPMTATSVATSLTSPHLTSLKMINGTVKVEEPQQRKPCNCTKSQCLKLYCDCFANGEFCSSCNCISCHNNLEHEEDRQKAIRQCLERNPQAFHPKIGKGRAGDLERRHTKGCNCRRSGCLKNYCECYEAKILCSGLCKCVGCKNFEESFERKTLMHLADAAEVRSAQQTVATKHRLWGSDFRPKLPIKVDSDRLACSFITPEVIEATCQCLLAQAEAGEKNNLDYKSIESLVLKEFGRCLTQIIDCANKTRNSKIKQELY